MIYQCDIPEPSPAANDVFFVLSQLASKSPSSHPKRPLRRLPAASEGCFVLLCSHRKRNLTRSPAISHNCFSLLHPNFIFRRNTVLSVLFASLKLLDNRLETSSFRNGPSRYQYVYQYSLVRNDATGNIMMIFRI